MTKELIKEPEKESVNAKAPKASEQNVNDIIKATSSDHASSISMVVIFLMVGGLIYFRKRNKEVK